MSVAPEVRELLRAIVRCAQSSDPRQLRCIAAKAAVWDSAIAIAQQHRIVPLLYEWLTKEDIPIPPKISDQLRNVYDRNAFHCLANAAELVRVLRQFEGQGIPAMPFKGVVLASSAYKTLTMRTAGDLDFLIFESDRSKATAALLASGYQLKTETRDNGSPAIENYYEFHFERPTDGMVLELRWRLELTQPRFHSNLGMGWVWPHRRAVKVAGVDVPDVDPERLLLVLCMHGSKHAWSRLLWVRDVAQLLCAHPELDWKAVKVEAKRVGLWRALALGVLLAYRVCGAAVPAEVVRGFQSDGEVRRLATYFENAVFDKPGEIPSGRLPYNLALLDFQDRVRLLLSAGFLQPNERDRELLRLPKALYPLYYLIRPFRVLLDRSAR
jgi:hypothetical protein